MGFQGNFFWLLLWHWALGITSASLGLLIGAGVASAKTAAEVLPAIFVPQMLFAGFFVPTSKIPVWVRWSQWLCGLKYAVNLSLAEEFDPSFDSCQGELPCFFPRVPGTLFAPLL